MEVWQELVRALRCGDVATIQRFFSLPQTLEAAARAEAWLAALSRDVFQQVCVDQTRRRTVAEQLARAMYGDVHRRLSHASVLGYSHVWFVASDGGLELSSFASCEAANETAAWLLASSLVTTTPLTIQWMLSVLAYYGAHRQNVELLDMLLGSAVFRDLYSEAAKKALLEHVTQSWIHACCSRSRSRYPPSIDVANVLLVHGVCLESLQRAVVIRSPSVDQFLLDNGAQVRGLDQVFQFCPTWLCVRHEYLQAMVHRGADPRNAESRHNWHLVISSGTIQAVHTLLDDWCVDVNAHPAGKSTPLMRAVSANHTWTIRRLLDLGADVSAADHDGRTALGLAVVKCSPTTIEVLLTAGADPNQTDIHGNTAFDLAKRRWQPDRPFVNELLHEYGTPKSRRM